MTVAVEVEDEAWLSAASDAESVVVRAAEAALAGARARGDLTVLLADDATLRDLNTRFRGKDAATNVLSFPAPSSAAPHLGDVALAFGVCAREAAEQHKSLHDHLSHLVAHGVLHLLGFDHDDDAQAEEMEALERAVLADLGVCDPYATRDA